MIIKRVVVLSPLTYCEDSFTNGGVGCGADFWRFPKACPNGQIRDVSSGQCVCPNANEEVVNDSGGNPSCLQKCDADQERLPITNNCVAKCGADEQRNPATNLCEKPPLCDNPAVGKSAKSATDAIPLPYKIKVIVKATGQLCMAVNCGQLLANIVQTISDISTKETEECNNNSSCSTATKFQLTQAGILDAHDFKAEFVGKKNVSRYDICACKDGSIKIAGHGCVVNKVQKLILMQF